LAQFRWRHRLRPCPGPGADRQRRAATGVAVPLRGTGEPGSVVHARLDDGATLDATVAADGTWQIALPPQAAGPGHALHFATSTGQQAQLANVAFGDVFLCSGQSNMEFTLRHATNADATIAGSVNPDIRLFNVPKQSSLTPQGQFGAPVAGARRASQHARFFGGLLLHGADIQATRHVPVGLIAASWGGSIIEDWMSPAALRQAAATKRACNCWPCARAIRARPNRPGPARSPPISRAPQARGRGARPT
jgi:sialate O-acetylesterase